MSILQMVEPSPSSDDTEEVLWQMHPDHAAWTDVGVTSYAAMKQWEATGLVPLDVEYLLDPDSLPSGACPLTMSEALEWAKRLDGSWLQFTEQALDWYHLGFTPDEAAAWSAAGLDSSAAVAARDANMTLEETAEMWAKSSLDSDTRTPWFGVATPDVAEAWHPRIHEAAVHVVANQVSTVMTIELRYGQLVFWANDAGWFRRPLPLSAEDAAAWETAVQHADLPVP